MVILRAVFTGLAVWIFISFADASKASASSVAEDKPTVTLLTVHYPPFNIRQSSEGLRGFDHEVAIAALARRGIQAQVQYVPWKRAVSDTQIGIAPILLTCAHTPERERYYHFSDPISHDRYGLVTRVGHDVSGIEDLDDLSGKLVATVAGYVAHKELAAIGATSMDIPAELIGLRMVLANRIDYLYAGIDTLAFEAKQAGLGNAFAHIELRKYTYYACFSKADETAINLRDEFNAGLAEVRADGTYDTIHAKYR